MGREGLGREYGDWRPAPETNGENIWLVLAAETSQIFSPLGSRAGRPGPSAPNQWPKVPRPICNMLSLLDETSWMPLTKSASGPKESGQRELLAPMPVARVVAVCVLVLATSLVS